MQRFRVAAYRGGTELAGRAIAQVFFNCVRNRGVMFLRCVERALVGFPAVEQALGAGPVARADRSADATAGHGMWAIDPDRAGAFRTGDAFGFMRTGLYVASVELKGHARRISQKSRVWYISGTRRFRACKLLILKGEIGAAGGI